MSQEFRDPEWRKLLVDAVSRLASDPTKQVKYIADLGLSPSLDELALDLADVVPMLPIMVREGALSREAADAVEALDLKLDEMSGEANQHLWVLGAIEFPEWDIVRNLASRAQAAIEKDSTRER